MTGFLSVGTNEKVGAQKMAKVRQKKKKSRRTGAPSRDVITGQCPSRVQQGSCTS